MSFWLAISYRKPDPASLNFSSFQWLNWLRNVTKQPCFAQRHVLIVFWDDDNPCGIDMLSWDESTGEQKSITWSWQTTPGGVLLVGVIDDDQGIEWCGNLSGSYICQCLSISIESFFYQSSINKQPPRELKSVSLSIRLIFTWIGSWAIKRRTICMLLSGFSL